MDSGVDALPVLLLLVKSSLSFLPLLDVALVTCVTRWALSETDLEVKA